VKLLISLSLTIALASINPIASADTLLIDVIAASPSNSADGLSRPSRGQSMDQTRAQYGNPVEEKPWVGDPPITRWIYDQYTVYFEHEHVINTVVHR